jgi:hypothetical protein
VLGVRDPVLMVVAISLAESRASDTVSPSSSEAKLLEESRSTVLAWLGICDSVFAGACLRDGSVLPYDFMPKSKAKNVGIVTYLWPRGFRMFLDDSSLSLILRRCER